MCEGWYLLWCTERVRIIRLCNQMASNHTLSAQLEIVGYVKSKTSSKAVTSKLLTIVPLANITQILDASLGAMLNA